MLKNNLRNCANTTKNKEMHREGLSYLCRHVRNVKVRSVYLYAAWLPSGILTDWVGTQVLFNIYVGYVQ